MLKSILKKIEGDLLIKESLNKGISEEKWSRIKTTQNQKLQMKNLIK